MNQPIDITYTNTESLEEIRKKFGEGHIKSRNKQVLWIPEGYMVVEI